MPLNLDPVTCLCPGPGPGHPLKGCTVVWTVALPVHTHRPPPTVPDTAWAGSSEHQAGDSPGAVLSCASLCPSSGPNSALFCPVTYILNILCKLDVILMFHVKTCLGEGKPLAQGHTGGAWELEPEPVLGVAIWNCKSRKSSHLRVVPICRHEASCSRGQAPEPELGVLTLKLVRLDLLISNPELLEKAAGRASE